MPELVGPLTGFEPVEALWRLFRRRGGEGGLQAFREDHPVDGSVESLAERLERQGIPARPALVEAEELAYLEAPTILELRDGSWVLLQGRTGQALRVEGNHGLRTLPVRELAPVLSGQALDLCAALPPGETLWHRLGGLLAHHRRRVAEVAAATMLLQLLALAVPEITGAVMDRALPDGARSTLHLVAAGVVLVALFQAWTGWIREKTLLFLVTRIEVAAERGLLTHLLLLPYSFLQGKTLGERLQAFTGLAGAREALAERALAAVLDGLLAVVYVAAMASKLAAPTVAVVAVATAMAGLAACVGAAQARQQTLEMTAQARERSYLAEIIAGIATVKAAGAEGHVLRSWLRHLGAELAPALRRQRLGLSAEVGQEALRQGLHAVLLLWGGALVLRGELTVGTLFAFVLLSAGFLAAVYRLVGAHLLLATLRPQLAWTHDVLARTPEPRPHRLASPARAARVAIEDVWFRYGPGEPWILKGYSLRVEAGAKQVITGPSGFGKSTVLRLLAGLHVPEEGSITIGGRSPQAARRDVLYLPQLVSLYGGTVIDNLRLLSGGAPPEALRRAAESTGLDELVATWPMGYRTLLPHGGASLSGGQRQLIAFTAAIASGRQVLLLDEAMANVDALCAARLHRRLHEAPATVLMARHLG